MGTEVLLYGYGFVCLSMLAFNILYNLAMKGSQRRLERKGTHLAVRMESQLRRIRQGLPVEPGHLSFLRRRLTRVGCLLAFDRALERLPDRESDPAAALYLHQIHPVLLQLAMLYWKRDSLQAAYFAYFLARHRLEQGMPMDSLQEIMVAYMKKDNLYCRMNALQALYAFGSPERVAEAVLLQDRTGAFFHEKVLTDGLLSFQGDHGRLIRLLWAEFERVSDKTRLSILNYIRFRTGDYRREMYDIMQDPARDKELRLSALRYFGRYQYPPARAALIAFVRSRDAAHWEYAAVAATVLAQYPGEDTAAALMEAVHSANWYVRYNAAASLEHLQLHYSDLIQVMGGRDRYAREMMMYRLDARNLEREEARRREGEESPCAT